MKPISNKFLNLAAAFLPMAIVAVSPLAAAPVTPPAGTNAPQSVFVMPESPKEGRDPFFPNSTHPYLYAIQLNNKQPEITALNLVGITRSGSRVFVIINNVTLGTGEDADVKTPTGKIHLRVVEIKTDAVVIEASGQIHTLTLSNK